jgi:hypothetical protein
MAQNENNYGTRDVVNFARAFVRYDNDTLLGLHPGRWANGGSGTYVTQYQYDASAAYEITPGLIDIVGAAPTNTGGVLSGRLRLAVSPEGGYDRTMGHTGVKLNLVNAKAAGMSTLQSTWDMVADESGNLYVAGSDAILTTGKVWKVTKNNGVRDLKDILGRRVGDAGVFTEGASALATAGFGVYTGLAIDADTLFAANRFTLSIDVYKTDGTVVGTADLSALGMIVEDAEVLSSSGDITRLVVNVLDPDVRLVVVDVNRNDASVVVKQLVTNQQENGDTSADLQRNDRVFVSPDGDIVVYDSRGSNDGRWIPIGADEVASWPMDGSTVASSNNNSMYGDITFDYAGGLAFTPEPATLALLAMGGLAMIRRRK